MYWKCGALGPWLMNHRLLWSTVDQEPGTTVGSPEDDRPTATVSRCLSVVARKGEGGGAVLTVGKKGRQRHGHGPTTKGLATTVMTSLVCRLERGGGKLGAQMDMM
jgi:hypothetical protein